MESEYINKYWGTATKFTDCSTCRKAGKYEICEKCLHFPYRWFDPKKGEMPTEEMMNTYTSFPVYTFHWEDTEDDERPCYMVEDLIIHRGKFLTDNEVLGWSVYPTFNNLSYIK